MLLRVVYVGASEVLPDCQISSAEAHFAVGDLFADDDVFPRSADGSPIVLRCAALLVTQL